MAAINEEINNDRIITARKAVHIFFSKVCLTAGADYLS